MPLIFFILALIVMGAGTYPKIQPFWTANAAQAHDMLMLIGSAFAPVILTAIGSYFVLSALCAFKYPNRTSGWSGRLLPAELASLTLCTGEDDSKVQAILVREAVNPKFYSLDNPKYGGPVRLFGRKFFI